MESIPQNFRDFIASLLNQQKDRINSQFLFKSDWVKLLNEIEIEPSTQMVNDKLLFSIINDICIKNFDKSDIILSLDGDGTSVIVEIFILIYLQHHIPNIFDHVKWIAGNGTGALVASMLWKGYDIHRIMEIFVQFIKAIFAKDVSREKIAKEMLKRIFGSDTRIFQEENPTRLMLPIVYVKSFPFHRGSLCSFRKQCCSQAPDLGIDHTTYLLWEAVYHAIEISPFFDMYEMFTNAGLISNNPVCDMIMAIEGNERYATITIGSGVSKGKFNRSKIPPLFIHSVACSEGEPVSDARTLSHCANLPFFRLSPQITDQLLFEEIDTDKLTTMLWETLVYLESNKKMIDDITLVLTK